MVDKKESAHVTIPSDALRALLDLRNEFPFFRQLLGDIIQTVMVLDASAIQGELRWRLGSRTKPNARTGLHEAIDSGVVIAFAPVFLREEIEKYLFLIANETGVTFETANAEWLRVQSLIRFYAPVGDGTRFALVDLKDSDYVLTWQELDADFVRTGDHRHFMRMGATVIGPELDAVLRDYARSTSVLITVKLGSGFVVTIGIQALVEMFRGIVEMFRRVPPAVRLILGLVVAAIILHPHSRAKVTEWAKSFWERLRDTRPVLVSISKEAVKRLAEAAQTSRAAAGEINSRLRLRGKQTALSHLRLICLRSEEPLSADEIARRILANGYSSRSRTFPAYIRRLLRQDARFVADADGLWMLRSAA